VLDELQRLAGFRGRLRRLRYCRVGFFSRVDGAYEQSDRDLDLKTRSLQLSSVELTHTNARIRVELASRTRAIDSLRETAHSLMQTMGTDVPILQDDNLESLSRLMSDLVQEREESQKDLQSALTDLANQKFALDQHGIVSITDVMGRILYANDKFCEISGYRVSSCWGKSRIIKSDVHTDDFLRTCGMSLSGEVWQAKYATAKAGACIGCSPPLFRCATMWGCPPSLLRSAPTLPNAS
jgi:hypothetical protein